MNIPDHNRTVVEQLMDDAGHSLIYTPPFCPGGAADRTAVGEGEALRGRSFHAQSIHDRGARADRARLRAGHEDVLQQHRQALPRLDRLVPPDGRRRGSAAVRHSGWSHQASAAAQDGQHRHITACEQSNYTRSLALCCCFCGPCIPHSAHAPLTFRARCQLSVK